MDRGGDAHLAEEAAEKGGGIDGQMERHMDRGGDPHLAEEAAGPDPVHLLPVDQHPHLRAFRGSEQYL